MSGSAGKKKGKKAGDGSGDAPVFDYNAIIPKNMDDRSREMVKAFLRNESMTEEKREEALMVFATALLAEQGNDSLSQRLAHVDVADKPGNVAVDFDAAAQLTTAEMTDEEFDAAILAAIRSKGPKVKNEDGTSSSASVAASSTQAQPRSDFEPNPECLNEERCRINVGWMAGPSDTSEDCDRKIAQYSQKLGCQLYNYVCFPVGGVKRGFWKPTGPSDTPPPIDLPDLQLQNHLWETYVNGQLSNWIDCDAEEEWLCELSERELEKELNYVAYMGLRSVVVPLKRADSPRLAALLNRWMWQKPVNVTFWVFVPTDRSTMISRPDDDRDVWGVWADFRTACSNFSSSKLIAGLRLTADVDDEFVDAQLLERWKGEPLACFWVDEEAFVTNNHGIADLPPMHVILLEKLWVSDSARIIVKGSGTSGEHSEKRTQYAQALRKVVGPLSRRPVQGITDEGFLADGNIDYMDVLQAPLQPLADNLDSNVYNTFEQDPIKYKKYNEAVYRALVDLAKRDVQSLVLYVLGAGRGPLVTASLEAEVAFNEKHRSRHDRLKLTVVVVEKNSNAIVTLKYLNQRAWRGRCTIVESDMRRLPPMAEEMGLPRPDIIVSELLGSFGDNELSPECLDGVTPWLKPTTISIPQKYISYVAPIQSLHMYQSIVSGGASYWHSGVSGHGRDGSVQQENGTYKQNYPQGTTVAQLDQVYVVYLRQYCPLGPPKEVFTFEHPNFENTSNERSGRIEFDMEMPSDVMGFAAYFHMWLYKDVELSIVPGAHSRGMISWFPALIPLRKPHRVGKGEKIALCIERKVDSQGVWYEWQVEWEKNGQKERTTLQNENGESYYMRLL